RPGAWRRHAGAGAGRARRIGIRAEPDQEDGGRRRPCRQGADQADDRRAAAEGGAAVRRRRRRARHRRVPRASPRQHRDGGEIESGGAMIGKLKGIVDSYGEDNIILDVGGVGYLVHCSARTLQALPAPGEAATLSIETYVREDQIKLFGFASDAEREWFRILQTVQGVGAKVALAVLGTLKPA